MACFIKAVEEEQCVYVSYAGDLPPCELAAARYEAYGILRRRCWTRIVMDLTQLRSVLTGVQVFDLATGLAAQIPQHARMALVVRPDQVQNAILVVCFKLDRPGLACQTLARWVPLAAEWLKPIYEAIRTGVLVEGVSCTRFLKTANESAKVILPLATAVRLRAFCRSPFSRSARRNLATVI